MRVETPQILWNAEGDSGKINAALMSLAMIESGSASTAVLATAGNASDVNLWRLTWGASTKIDYLCNLTRHDSPVNALRFSPDGLHLATASDAGAMIVWSVPAHYRGGGNGRHYWSGIASEKDLTVKIVAGNGDGIVDLSWSSDSKRFLAGGIDHSLSVVEDENYGRWGAEASWKIVYRNGMDHTHFVQGTAYDPSGVYLATMSSDRSVRIHMRKAPGKAKKKVLRPASNSSVPPTEHAAMVEELLTEAKLEFGKSKPIKYRKMVTDVATGAVSRQHLFADETNLESFVRRLAWTSDGAFLIAPAALWQVDEGKPSFATAVFARHRFDEPCRILPLMEKPSIAVCANPVPFQLRSAYGEESSKENKAPQGLPYRSLFAVLTHDSIIVYDTVSEQPVSIVTGVHYCNLVDAAWSADGHHLVVCSTDGYVSIVSFESGELGTVYQTPSTVTTTATTTTTSTAAPEPVKAKPTTDMPLPPCEAGPTLLETRPAKRAKKIAPTLIESAPAVPVTVDSHTKRGSAEDVGAAVDKLSLGEQAKKKKRIQPVLMSSN